MENANKALIMAGGMLITVLVISLLVLFYNQIKGFKSATLDTSSEQAFNASFEAFNRNGVYGSELFSLAYKVVDYNYNQYETKGYTPITLEVQMKQTYSMSSKMVNAAGTNVANPSEPNYFVTSQVYTSDQFQKVGDHFDKSHAIDTKKQITYQISRLENDVIRQNKYCEDMLGKKASELVGLRTVEWNKFCEQYKDKYFKYNRLKNSADNYLAAKTECVDPYTELKALEQQVKQAQFDCIKIDYGDTGRIEYIKFVQE